MGLLPTTEAGLRGEKLLAVPTPEDRVSEDRVPEGNARVPEDEARVGDVVRGPAMIRPNCLDEGVEEGEGRADDRMDAIEPPERDRVVANDRPLEAMLLRETFRGDDRCPLEDRREPDDRLDRDNDRPRDDARLDRETDRPRDDDWLERLREASDRPNCRDDTLREPLDWADPLAPRASISPNAKIAMTTRQRR